LGPVLPVIMALTLGHSHATGRDWLDVSRKDNLVGNPGFEVSRKGLDRPVSWNVGKPGPDTLGWTYEYVKDSTQARTGARCVKFSSVFSRGYSKNRLSVMTGSFSITAADRYLWRVWYRTDGVGDGEVLAKLKYYNSLGKSIGSDSVRLDATQNKWSPFDLYIHPMDGPSGSVAAKAKVFLFLDHSPGSVWFDDIGLYRLSAEEIPLVYPYGRYRAPQIVTTGPLPVFPASDAVSIRQDASGVWWTVRSDGTPSYRTETSLTVNRGTRPLITHVWQNRDMSLGQYYEEIQVRARNDLHFNAGGKAHAGADKDFPIEWLNFSTKAKIPGTGWVLRNAAGETFGGSGHYFPDPFNPLWRAYGETEVLEVSDAVEERDAVGYWTDNEWVYGPMFEFFWSRHCRRALVDWLQGKLKVPQGYELSRPYANIMEINHAWSSEYHTYSYSAFEEIYGRDKPRARAFDDPTKDDLYAFERVVYKTYVDTITNGLRRAEDKAIARLAAMGKKGYHHSIISCRMGWNGPGYHDSALRRNMDIFSAFDIIAVNAYPSWQNAADHGTRARLEAMRKTFHETTGKPVIIAEFGIAGRDSGIPSRATWRPLTVNTQAERGEGYRNLTATWANMPWIIGHIWYKWPNSYGLDGKEPQNCGIVDDTDKYYENLVNRMVQTNLQLNKIRRGADFDIDKIDWRPLALPVYEGVAPDISIIEPDGTNDTTAGSCTIRWKASDPDSEALITLYAGIDTAAAVNGEPIAENLVEGVDTQFAWDLSAVPAGTYMIVASINDGTGPSRWAEGPGRIEVKEQSRAVRTPKPPAGPKTDSGISP